MNRHIEGLWEEYATANGIKYVVDETYNWTEEEEDDDDYEDMEPILKKYIIPNFYEQWHIPMMDGWSAEKVQDFKDYMSKQICSCDLIKKVVEDYIADFEDAYNN